MQIFASIVEREPRSQYAPMCNSLSIGKSNVHMPCTMYFISFWIISFQLQIIVAISEIPPFLASFLYPVIKFTTDKEEPSHIYFLEDALELWLVVVQNSTALTPELLGLSTNLLPIIGTNFWYCPYFGVMISLNFFHRNDSILIDDLF